MHWDEVAVGDDNCLRVTNSARWLRRWRSSRRRKWVIGITDGHEDGQATVAVRRSVVATRSLANSESDTMVVINTGRKDQCSKHLSRAVWL
jgi:hypothetical protein